MSKLVDYSTNPINNYFEFFGHKLETRSIEYRKDFEDYHTDGITYIITAKGRMSFDDDKNPFGIKSVVFNGPATIVFWNDGTKTVVKCADGEIYNKRTAIMWAIMKKAYGNSSKVNKAFDELIEGDEVASDNVNDDFSANPSLSSAVKNFVNSMYGVKASQK